MPGHLSPFEEIRLQTSRGLELLLNLYKKHPDISMQAWQHALVSHLVANAIDLGKSRESLTGAVNYTYDLFKDIVDKKHVKQEHDHDHEHSHDEHDHPHPHEEE